MSKDLWSKLERMLEPLEKRLMLEVDAWMTGQRICEVMLSIS
jgi:hypothetical protein